MVVAVAAVGVVQVAFDQVVHVVAVGHRGVAAAGAVAVVGVVAGAQVLGRAFGGVLRVDRQLVFVDVVAVGVVQVAVVQVVHVAVVLDRGVTAVGAVFVLVGLVGVVAAHGGGEEAVVVKRWNSVCWVVAPERWRATHALRSKRLRGGVSGAICFGGGLCLWLSLGPRLFWPAPGWPRSGRWESGHWGPVTGAQSLGPRHWRYSGLPAPGFRGVFEGAGEQRGDVVVVEAVEDVFARAPPAHQALGLEQAQALADRRQRLARGFGQGAHVGFAVGQALQQPQALAVPQGLEQAHGALDRWGAVGAHAAAGRRRRALALGGGGSGRAHASTFGRTLAEVNNYLEKAQGASTKRPARLRGRTPRAARGGRPASGS